MKAVFIFFALTIHALVAFSQSYQICPMVSSLDAAGNPILTASGSPVLVPDPACVAVNKEAATSAGNTQASGFVLSGTTVLAPPPAPNCGAPGTPGYNSCIDAYNNQVAIYNANAAQNTASSTPLSTEQQNLVDVPDNSSALGVLSQMIEANKEGKKVYTDTSGEALVAGVSQLTLAAGCASTCTASGTATGCCSESSEYFAAGAGYLLSSRQADAQAVQHYEAGYTACEGSNKISTVQLDCNAMMGTAPVSTTVTSTTTASSIVVTLATANTSSPVVFDAYTGTCTPPDLPTCKKLVSRVGAPSLSVQQALKDVLKNSKIDTKTLYKFNADGSVNVGNNKNFSAKDFLHASGLVIKGVAAVAANKIISALSAFMPQSLEKTISIKVGDAKPVPVSSTEVVSAETIDPVARGRRIVEEVSIPKDICAQQLTTYWEDEPIGVSKNNIFIMIKCEYHREIDRESFLVD